MRARWVSFLLLPLRALACGVLVLVGLTGMALGLVLALLFQLARQVAWVCDWAA